MASWPGTGLADEADRLAKFHTTAEAAALIDCGAYSLAVYIYMHILYLVEKEKEGGKVNMGKGDTKEEIRLKYRYSEV